MNQRDERCHCRTKFRSGFSRKLVPAPVAAFPPCTAEQLHGICHSGSSDRKGTALVGRKSLDLDAAVPSAGHGLRILVSFRRLQVYPCMVHCAEPTSVLRSDSRLYQSSFLAEDSCPRDGTCQYKRGCYRSTKSPRQQCNWRRYLLRLTGSLRQILAESLIGKILGLGMSGTPGSDITMFLSVFVYAIFLQFEYFAASSAIQRSWKISFHSFSYLG